MKRILSILLSLIAYNSYSQQVVDSVTFRFRSGDIKYYVVRSTATGVGTDSIGVWHNGIRTLLSPFSLPISTLMQAALDGKQGLITNGSITNAMLAGSIDLPTKVTGVLPFANGGRSAAVSAPATTGTMTINMTSSIVTITPSGACTFNASGGVAGQTVTFAITTSGVTSFTLTFGINFRKVGTLATGTTSARFFSVTFICLDGVIWQEVARTAAQS